MTDGFARPAPRRAAGIPPARQCSRRRSDVRNPAAAAWTGKERWTAGMRRFAESAETRCTNRPHANDAETETHRRVHRRLPARAGACGGGGRCRRPAARGGRGKPAPRVPGADARAWSAGGGAPPRVSFGSSGNLYRQIAQGAPFDLFLSADEEQALKLVRTGRTEGEGTIYATGRLVLLVPEHSRLALDGSLADLGRAIGDGRVSRLAIANPAHAPYGRAAREALERTALWSRLQGRLLLAENAAQAVQFALTRGADGGLSYRTRSRSPNGSRARRVTWCWTRPCTRQSSTEWCCFRRAAGRMEGRCSDSWPDRRRGASSNDSDSPHRAMHRIERRHGFFTRNPAERGPGRAASRRRPRGAIQERFVLYPLDAHRG